MTATVTCPNSSTPCSMTSRWPRWIGSKLPGLSTVIRVRSRYCRLLPVEERDPRAPVALDPALLPARRRGHRGGGFGDDEIGPYGAQQTGPLVEPVRRIGERQVGGQLRCRSDAVADDHACSVAQPEHGDVLLDRPHRAPVALHERA